LPDVAKTSHLYKFFSVDEDTFGAIAPTVPGCFWKNKILFAPENCAWLANEELMKLGAVFRLIPPPARKRVKWSEIVERVRGEFREEVSSLGQFPDYFLRHQKEGVTFLLNRPNESGQLFHPTGSGKSLSVITWLLYDSRPGLLVTKAAARRTLYDEFIRYTKVEPIVLVPRSDLRKKDVDPYEQIEKMLESDPVQLPRVVIVGLERLPDQVDFLSQIPFGSVAFDEIHRHASHRRFVAIPKAEEGGTDEDGNPLLSKPEFKMLSNIATAAMRLAGNAKRRCGATATALPDRPRNLWAPLDLVCPWEFGSAWNFYKRFCDVTTGTYGQLDNSGASNIEELKRRLAFVAHKVDYKTAQGDLPLKRRQNWIIERAQQDAPSDFSEELERARENGARSLVEVRLAEATTRKFTVILDKVKDAIDSKQKILLFVNRHSAVEKLERLFFEEMPDLMCWAAHGGTPPKGRDEIREEYMAHPGPCLLIGTIEAFGESISLHDTDLMILASIPINYRQLWQVEGRVARRGQKRPVLVLYAIAEGTIDEHYLSILLSKLPAVDKIMEDSELSEAYKDLAGFSDDSLLDSLFEKLKGDSCQE
jgi:hypothetical protein